jgi:hypothetical protein
MVSSSGGLGPESDFAGKAQITLVQVNSRLALSSEKAPHTKRTQMSEDNFRGEK